MECWLVLTGDEDGEGGGVDALGDLLGGGCGAEPAGARLAGDERQDSHLLLDSRNRLDRAKQSTLSPPPGPSPPSSPLHPAVAFWVWSCIIHRGDFPGVDYSL